MTTEKKRRRAPDTGEVILEAALEVIASYGVSGTTHRKVAEQAGVSLGSVTHRFGTVESLLLAAFSQLRTTISARFEARLAQATTREEAQEAVVDLICDGSWTTSRNMALTYELYALGARKQSFRSIQSDWMMLSRTYLERHFAPTVARTLDALIEGATIQNASSEVPLSVEEIRKSVKSLSN